MKTTTLHTFLTVLTLAVMTLTSTGFTAVVRYCTMGDIAECCCEEMQTVPVPDAPTVKAPEMSCNVQTIAGGRNEIDATVQSIAADAAPALDVVLSGYDASQMAAPEFPCPLFTLDHAAPPGVDIYIRVNSFLI
ncbi:MAG: hypothetical protein ACM3Q4_12230 [Acidobacteriota bacterium]